MGEDRLSAEGAAQKERPESAETRRTLGRVNRSTGICGAETRLCWVTALAPTP